METEKSGFFSLELPRFRLSIWMLVGFWTIAIATVLTFEVIDERNQAEALLRKEARGAERSEQAIRSMEALNIRDRILGYGGMWLLGLGGIAVFHRHLHHQMRRRREAEQRLQDAHDRLELRVAERTAELAKANRSLESEIAERRKAEQWLLQSEERFRGFFEQGLIGMAMMSPAKEWIEVNDRLCRMLGYTRDELAVVDWNKLTHPDDLAAEDARFRSLLDGSSRGLVFEKRFIRKGGEVFHAALSAQCLRDPDGKLDCLLALVMGSERH